MGNDRFDGEMRIIENRRCQISPQSPMLRLTGLPNETARLRRDIIDPVYENIPLILLRSAMPNRGVFSWNLGTVGTSWFAAVPFFPLASDTLRTMG
jgi:hypothetical protein